MKKHLVSVVVALCLLMTSALALTREQINTADALNSLGLFNGTDKGYELNVQLKRSDAITLLVRLLGKEADAKSGKYSHPFTDVAEWLDPYVAYAYNAGYTTGTGDATYGSTQSMTRAEYYTIVLRAMGYSDKGETPDFAWNDAHTFAATLGLTDSDAAKSKFSRADAIEVFWKALSLNLKGQSKTLSQSLVEQGVFTDAELAEAAKLQSNPYPNEEMIVSERTGNLLTKRQYIVEKTAYAYWDKHMHTDYDQYSYIHGTAFDTSAQHTRREARSSPEWASPERRIFLDCSSYQTATYYNVFGEEMRNYVPWHNTTNMASHAATGTGDDVIYHHVFKAKTRAEYEQVAAEMLELFEPGDIFVYRRASSGHVVMYLDGGTTLESTGGSYYVRKGRDRIDANGTIKLRDIGYFLDLSRSTNILTKGNLVNISIIRPLNAIPLEPSANSLARLDLGRLSMSKLSMAPGQTVEQGDIITFKIVLDNQPDSDTSKNLVVDASDPLPTNVEFISASDGGALVDGVVTWKNISVKNNEVKTLTYTVRVAANDGLIECGMTNVGGVEFMYRDIQIGTNMTATQFQTLKATLNGGMTEGESALDFVNRLYKTAVGSDLGVTTADELIDNLYAPQLDGGGNTRYRTDVDESTNVGKAAVHGYVVGRRVLHMSKEDNQTRTRYLHEQSFQLGDLLFVHDTMLRTHYYVYLGSADGFVHISDAGGIENETVSYVLEPLLAQRFFTLLRPSMI